MASAYTKLFESLLDHPGVELCLGTYAAALLDVSDSVLRLEGRPFAGPVIYTGATDELFGCVYGRLPYRTLGFRLETHRTDFYQSRSTVNYTVDRDYTRITEFKRLTDQSAPGLTTIAKEYSRPYRAEAGDTPYYAVSGPDSQALYRRYAALAARHTNLHLLGRLAEYKYYLHGCRHGTRAGAVRASARRTLSPPDVSLA